MLRRDVMRQVDDVVVVAHLYFFCQDKYNNLLMYWLQKNKNKVLLFYFIEGYRNMAM